MRLNKLFVMAALVGGTMLASAAGAQVTSSFLPGTMGFQPLETAIDDFNGYASVGDDAHFTYTGNVGFYTDTTPGVAAAPAGDGTQYLAVLSGGSATFNFGKAYHTFSLDVGSVDDYNSLMITLFGAGGSVTLSGSQLNAGNSANGDQSNPLENGRLSISSPWAITGFTASSTGNSFELDNVGVSGAVPEPATWAFMFAGFGAIGLAMRGHRQQKLQTIFG